MTDSTGQLNQHARTIVHHIAQQISDIKPWQPITRSIRSQTLPIACHLYGYSTYADTVSDAARALMPIPRPGETRGEYALRLRAKAGKVHA